MNNNAHEVLKRFLTAKSKYFSLADGETACVTFLSASEIPNNFDGGKTMLIRYELKVNGIVQLWDRPSRQLAQEMMKFMPGTVLTISRKGEKNQTKYSIKEVTQ